MNPSAKKITEEFGWMGASAVEVDLPCNRAWNVGIELFRLYGGVLEEDGVLIAMPEIKVGGKGSSGGYRLADFNLVGGGHGKIIGAGFAGAVLQMDPVFAHDAIGNLYGYAADDDLLPGQRGGVRVYFFDGFSAFRPFNAGKVEGTGDR